MKYMLMFYLTQTEFDARTDPTRRDAFWGSFMPYLKAVEGAGIFAAGAGLEPAGCGDDDPNHRWQATGARRAICRHQGTARGVLSN